MSRPDRSTAPSGGPGRPLVSIGIPAYNRPAGLETAVRSALAQDWQAIEVIISDDASPDPAVGKVARKLSADGRVKVLVQQTNLGHDGNYQAVLEAASGEYFMWLADDDWIDPGYVRGCMEALRSDATVALACGRGHYYDGDRHVLEERPTNLRSSAAWRRVAGYFSSVSLNGPLFGVAKRDDLLAIGFPRVPGGDWLLVAALASRGRVVTLEQVRIHRSLKGLGTRPSELATSFGLSGLAARQHHVLVALLVARSIAVGRPVSIVPGGPMRIACAAFSACSILIRFTAADLVRAALGEARAERVERWVGRRLHRTSR